MPLDLNRPLVVTGPNWLTPCPARLLTSDLRSSAPLVVAIELAMGEEMVLLFHRDGSFSGSSERLRNATVPREGWVVVNKTENVGCWGTYSPVYADENTAIRVAEASGENVRVARVEWEEDAG